jgi:enterochelin esterase-like enzyme
MDASTMRKFAQTCCTSTLTVMLIGSTLLAQSSGPFVRAGTSPRIQKLRQQLADDVNGAADDFWATLAREHAPIIEPVPRDLKHVLITFIWRHESGTKSVQVAGMDMTLLPNTDIWYVTVTMERDLPLSYSFKPVKDLATDVPATEFPDPLNPRRFIPPVGQERPVSAVRTTDLRFMKSSILVLPETPSSVWVDPRPGVPAGRVDEHTFESKVYDGVRRVWVYTPPLYANKAKQSAGLLICFGGLDYLNEIPVPTILDNLISEGKIPPLTAIFVDNSGDRFQNFQSTQKFTDSLTNELIPWARRTLDIPTDPRRTIVTGYSAAGLESVYVAFRRPDLFGNVLAQSGAFWRGFEGEGASDYEWLASHFAVAPKQDTKFYMEVGGREDSKAVGVGPVFKDANRRLSDVLQKKGYTVSYTEVPGAQHEFIHWRSKFADGLLFLTAGWDLKARP